MKKIEAIIKLVTVDKVIEALVRVGVSGVTLMQVRGSGRQKGHCELYRGDDHAVNLLTKVKLEVLAPDDRIGEIISTLQATASTGRIGDGKIFVRPVEEVIRIRTGERGARAV
jgi:nitrogen regulatory protein P-II 1